MGETKHICYCQSRQCKSLTGKMDKELIRSDRDRLKENIRIYLSEEPCVGAAVSELPVNDTANDLCRIYVKAINLLHQSQQKRDSHESLQLSALLGDLFTGFWSVISGFNMPNEKYRLYNLPAIKNKGRFEVASTEELKGLLNTPMNFSDDDVDFKDIAESADLLCQSFLRSLGELEYGINDANPSIVMHHMALVGDTIHEMMRLVITLNPDRFTEERLPEDHPHARVLEKFKGRE